MSSLQLRRPRALYNAVTKRRLMAALVIAAVLCVALAVTTILWVRSDRKMKAAHEQIEQSILSDLTMMIRTYDRMSEPKIDIGGEILPEISKHLYSAYMQDNALVDMRGRDAAIMGNELYSNIESAVLTIDREVKADRIVNATNNALTPYIEDVHEILDAHLGEGGQNNLGGMAG